MADIFKRINKNNSYTIYDMFEVNFLQYYYLKMNNHNPVLNIFNTKLNLINSISNLKKFEKKNKDYLFIANWSISEFPLNFRKKFISTILNSKYSLISFQENFEGINNLKFFKNILKKTNNKYFYKIEPLNHYNNALFNNNKHYILSIIKKMSFTNKFYFFAFGLSGLLIFLRSEIIFGDNIIAPFTDDFFIITLIQQIIFLKLGLISFDKINLTNGYQPLWFFFILLLKWIIINEILFNSIVFISILLFSFGVYYNSKKFF